MPSAAKSFALRKSHLGGSPRLRISTTVRSPYEEGYKMDVVMDTVVAGLLLQRLDGMC